MKMPKKNTERKSAPHDRGHLRQPTAGSRDCWRTRNVSAPCGTCGARPEVVHIPTHERGFFCEACCPVCRAAQIQTGGEAGAPAEGIAPPHRDGALLANAGANGEAFSREVPR